MKRFKIDVTALAALGIFAYVACFVVAAMQQTEPFVNVAQETLPKTVMLRMTMKEGGFLCTGVFISPTGHILTCDHCVDHEGLESVLVETYNGYSYFAEVLAKDKVRDLALLKINDKEKPFPYAKIADPRTLKIGQEVIAIGYPFGLDWTVTHGIISQLNRDFKDAYNRLQTDTFINPGNSGGPLFNKSGELVGINSFIMVPIPVVPFFVGYGFSVESGQLIEFISKFRGLDKTIPRWR